MADRITEEVDLDNPPIDPPGGCADPFLWRLARDKYETHRRNPAGECVTCPRWQRCKGSPLARDGMRTAMGQSVKETPYWKAFASVMKSHSHSSACPTAGTTT